MIDSSLRLLDQIGRYMVLTGRVLLVSFRKPPSWSLIRDQMYSIGFLSFGVVAITGFSTGLVLSAQSIFQLTDKGLAAVTGIMVTKGMITELGPILTAFMVTGRVGAAICAELGTMKVSEQIDALQSMSVNPLRHLIAPRFIAAICMFPLLTVFNVLMGVFGAYLLAIYFFGMSPITFLSPLPDNITNFDLLVCLIKALTFALIIVTVSCFKGLNTKGGAAGVGSATTNSVVLNYSIVLIVNFLLTLGLKFSSLKVLGRQFMIKAQKLCKAYDEIVVLKDFDLEINEGETLVILGRSGVGKSVFLKHVIGLEKPDSGSLEINGINVSDLSGPQLYKAIKNTGMLFQGGALFDSMTVIENTSFYLDQHGDVDSTEIEDRAKKALEMVGLAGTEYKMPSELSGGMKKRAALARLIVYRPQILLYDEPTTGLDPIHASQIAELIVKIQKELNATSIVVTHDIPTALTVAHRVAVLHEGRIIFIGDKEAFIHSKDEMIRDFLEKAIPKGVELYGK